MLRKILVVKNRAMGDAIIGLGAVQFLKEAFPSAEIDYALPSWICPLLEKSVARGIRVIPLDLSFKGLTKLFSMKYDLVLELHQSGSSGKFFKVFSYLTGIPYRFHNHHISEGPVIDQGIKKASIQRDLDGCWSALSQLGMSLKYPNFLNYEPKLEVQSELNGNIVLGIVATRSTKKWPLDSFARLACALADIFPDKEILIPISPSDEDRRMGLKLSKYSLPQKCKIVEKPLGQLVNELRSCSLYIGNDTGIKHLCISMGMKSLSFFGPEQPDEWHPYDLKRHPYLFVEPLSCRTEASHYCGLNFCETMYCQKQISVTEVISKLQKMDL